MSKIMSQVGDAADIADIEVELRNRMTGATLARTTRNVAGALVVLAYDLEASLGRDGTVEALNVLRRRIEKHSQ